MIGAIMDGELTPAQNGGLLVALASRGETIDEIVGAARAMRERSLAPGCVSQVPLVLWSFSHARPSSRLSTP